MLRVALATRVLLGCFVLGLSGATLQSLQEETLTMSERENKFLDWLVTKEFPKHDLKIKYFPTVGTNALHRGLTSTVDKKRGDVLLRIPSSMFMSKLSASRSKIGKVLDMLAAVVGEKVVLALHTLYESFQPDSEWKAYLDIMPPLNEMNNVLFWSEQDIALLQCPQEWQCPLIARARKQKNKVAKLFSELQPVMNEFFKPNQFTYDNFAWAYAISLSRSFALNITEKHGHSIVGDKKEDAKNYGMLSLMVPFCDFLNHHNAYPALQFSYDYNDTTKELVVYADKDYKAGEEVMISYGIMTNPDLLITYGFVLPNNAFETVGFALGLDQAKEGDDPLLSHKLKLLKKQQLEPNMQTHIALDGQPSPRFLEGMRIRELAKSHILPASSCGNPDNVPPGQFPPPPPGMKLPPGVPTPPGMPPMGKNMFPPPPNFAQGLPNNFGGTSPQGQKPTAGDMNALIADAVKQALGKVIPGANNAADKDAKPALDTENAMNEVLKNVLAKSGLGKLADSIKNQVSENAAGSKKTSESIETKLKAEKEKKEEEEKISKAFAGIDPSRPINGDNELSLYTSLMEGAETLLKTYPTSLEQDLYYFSDDYVKSPNAMKLTPRQKQALMMRIEVKRILHATILECMQGIKAAHEMQVKERDYGIPDEKSSKKDENINEMEVKRIHIQKQMLAHFSKGMSKWDDQWQEWRENIRMVWGATTALPKGTDFAARLGSSEEIIRRATERFDGGGDNDQGIRIGDFLRFTDVLSKEMGETKNSMEGDRAAFTGA